MTHRLRRRLVAAALLLAGAALVWLIVAPYIAAAAFVIDLSGQQPAWRRWLPVRSHAVSSRDLIIPTRHGAIAARTYEPQHPSRSVIVFPGIHGGGVEEPRLARFAQRLAATGARVLTVPLPDLRVFRIRDRSTDMIEDATAWMAGDRALAPEGRVGLVGISFAGGLALVAAGRPSLDGKLEFVVSFGGHGDLTRALAYLCTGQLPDGRIRPPHDYGLAVVALQAVPLLVPEDQAPELERGILTFLEGSLYGEPDPPRARRLFDEAAALGERLPEPARSLMRAVSNRDVATLGPIILPHVETLGRSRALSPERSPTTRAPVFLLHGAADNVIPSSETELLAAYLRSHGTSRVEALLTPLVSHATPIRDARAADVWRLIRFWSALNGAGG